MKTIIIGGVAGGATAAARLRRLKEHDEIILVEKGNHISYANCGIPYYIGGVIEKKRALMIQTPEQMKCRYNIDVRIHCEALSINLQEKRVALKNLETGDLYSEAYDKLILAPGAHLVVPQFSLEINDRRVLTLNNIPDMDGIASCVNDENSTSAVIIGGGFIGLETAENLTKKGLSVQVIELSNQILGAVDWDIAKMVQIEMEDHGVQIHTNEGVEKIINIGNKLRIETNKASYETDIVIVAIGVKPSTEFLNDSGILLTSKGAIIVNERMQTSDPDVYAAGDAVTIQNYLTEKPDYIPLAGPANKQGRIVADQIAGINSSYKGAQGSFIMKAFGKTVAGTGLTEKKAENSVKSYTYTKSHAAYYPNAGNIWIKVIFNKETGRLLGAQSFGDDGVDKRMDVFATAIRQKLTISDIADLELCYAPPYGSAKDPVNIAAYAAVNIINGLVNVIHWDCLEELDLNKAILLDVRTDKEYISGHIEGSIHIPIDQLRERMKELDTGKLVYVHCASGLRSYLACRILSQNGYECYNISGGYLLYNQLYLS